MNNIEINTEALKEKISELKIKKDKIKELFANIENRINELPDYWQSNTSESMLSDFKMLYKEFAIINDSNDKYVKFLESIVIQDYANKEDSLNELIDSNI